MTASSDSVHYICRQPVCGCLWPSFHLMCCANVYYLLGIMCVCERWPGLFCICGRWPGLLCICEWWPALLSMVRDDYFFIHLLFMWFCALYMQPACVWGLWLMCPIYWHHVCLWKVTPLYNVRGDQVVIYWWEITRFVW